MSPDLSLSMIVRDEEEVLGRVLDDVADLCREIVIVDTGSTDNTIKVAESYGAKVLKHEWHDDFAAARNVALENCQGEWVLWLDADDRVPKEAHEGLAAILNEVSESVSVEGVILPYYAQFDPTATDALAFTVNRERLLRNGIGLRWEGAIHEYVDIPSKRTVFRNNAWVEHHPVESDRDAHSQRNLEILRRLIGNGELSSKNFYYLGLELFRQESFEEAAEAFDQALRAARNIPENYEALCAAAECARKRGDDLRFRALYGQALALDPSHARAFVALGMYHFEREEWKESMPYFAAATMMERPTGNTQLVFETAYTWLPWDYLSVCMSKLGHYEAAIDLTMRAMLANPERERLFANLRYNFDQLDAARGNDNRPDWLRRSPFGF